MKKVILALFIFTGFNYNGFASIMGKTFLGEKKNPNAVDGMITVKKDFYTALETEYPNNTILENGVVIELWRVIYQDQPLQAGAPQEVVVFLAEKQSDIVVNKTNQSEGDQMKIFYKIANIPEQGDYVVLVYFNKIPVNFNRINISGHGDDGSGRTNLSFKSDAKIHIGTDKFWGMYSVPKFDTNFPLISNINFQTKASSGIAAQGLFDFFDDIVDWFKDAAKLIFEGGKELAGIIVSAAGEIYQQYLGIAITLIKEGRLPKYRVMSETEYNWANKMVFNGTLPPRLTLIITNLRFFKKVPIVLPGAALTYMHMGGLYDNPISVDPSTFIHELTHVWQLHQYGHYKYWNEGIKNQLLTGGDERAYKYDCGQNWNTYNFEQQGNIVANFYNWRIRNNFSYCLNSCEESHVIETVRSGKRYNFNELVNNSSQTLQLFQGKYTSTSNLRISKKVKIGSCNGTAIIGKN